MAMVMLIVISIMFIPLFLALCFLEAYLSLRKSLVAALIIPLVSFLTGAAISIVAFKNVIVCFLIFEIPFLILSIIFIFCRLIAKSKDNSKVKKDFKIMQIQDID